MVAGIRMGGRCSAELLREQIGQVNVLPSKDYISFLGRVGILLIRYAGRWAGRLKTGALPEALKVVREVVDASLGWSGDKGRPGGAYTYVRNAWGEGQRMGG